MSHSSRPGRDKKKRHWLNGSDTKKNEGQKKKACESWQGGFSQRWELWESTSELEEESKRNMNVELLLSHI